MQSAHDARDAQHRLAILRLSGSGESLGHAGHAHLAPVHDQQVFRAHRVHAAQQVGDVLALSETKADQDAVTHHVAAVIQRGGLAQFENHVIRYVHDGRHGA